MLGGGHIRKKIDDRRLVIKPVVSNWIDREVEILGTKREKHMHSEQGKKVWYRDSSIYVVWGSSRDLVPT